MNNTKELIELIESEIPHARARRLGFAEIHVDTLEEIIKRLEQPKITREEIGSLYRTLEGCVGTRKDNTGTIVYLSLQAEFELTEWLKSKGIEVQP